MAQLVSLLEHAPLPGSSANGRYVVFGSSATNLAAGASNAKNNIFVKDLDNLNLAPILVSTGLDGQQANDIVTATARRSAPTAAM